MTSSSLTSQSEKPDTFWRTLQTFNVTRIVVAMVMLAYVSSQSKGEIWFSQLFTGTETCGVYLLCAVLFTLVTAYHRRHYMLQIVLPITVDLVAVSILYIGAGGAKSGLAILYLFPLAGAAILAPLLVALLFVSIATMVLLADSGYQILQSSPDISTVQAGLYGGAFFFAVLVINRLAHKLIKQEELATQRGRDLRVQMDINRIAIKDMGDGLLVVDPIGTLIMANPAAERMLGLSFTMSDDEPRHKLSDYALLAPITDALFAWESRVSDLPRPGAPVVGEAVFVTIKHTDDLGQEAAPIDWSGRRELAAHLKVRFAAVRMRELSEYRAVIFLQDVSEIENQAQQLKLAAMGRLTASIAHEVRNPLASISYAATLLSEEAGSQTQARLVTIVEDNVARLDRMIEDILKLSRKAQRQLEPIQLAPLLHDIVNDFKQTHAVAPGAIALQIELTDRYHVWFDPLHLREVVTNLLSNAVRYASGRPGGMRLHIMSSVAGRLELHVQDDGEPISPAVRSHLFEPFYTTSSKGTGLGLFLARELCLNNGALLDYEYRHDVQGQNSSHVSGRFVIAFAPRDPLSLAD
ncbi:two-component system sensor histidine kinase PilS (NtrC family) [Collimonas sp. PA-H2]|uniref:sensor histidine kinase n=1 Tax=Collimonas sp. PA-H2 TaxID=1881062 RepID=UPI000C0138E1|nr:ATP-binding protein [Collimonas sp. PA-H2]PFH09106.1 two-component system sensor histidine kinase PilS (NtrC family) [Collimonas sp. PA-H2]